jgi:hypothetical protein
VKAGLSYSLSQPTTFDLESRFNEFPLCGREKCMGVSYSVKM